MHSALCCGWPCIGLVGWGLVMGRLIPAILILLAGCAGEAVTVPASAFYGGEPTYIVDEDTGQVDGPFPREYAQRLIERNSERIDRENAARREAAHCAKGGDGSSKSQVVSVSNYAFKPRLTLVPAGDRDLDENSAEVASGPVAQSPRGADLTSVDAGMESSRGLTSPSCVCADCRCCEECKCCR